MGAMAEPGGHLGDGVCQQGGGTGAGQDEGECEARLHADAATSPLPAARSALAANIFIPLVLKNSLGHSRHKLPSEFFEGPLEAGGSGRAVWARQHGNMAGRGNSRFTHHHF